MGDKQLVFVIALPRSCSAWVANWVSPAFGALHEPLCECSSVAQLRDRIDALPNGVVVVADTVTSALIDPIIAEYRGARYLIIDRDPADVLRSLQAAGISIEGFGLVFQAFVYAKRAINARQAPSLSINHGDLYCEELARDVWSFIGGEGAPAFDKDRWLTLRDLQVECIVDRVDAKITPGALKMVNAALRKGVK